MTNPSKQKGTRFETDIVNYLNTNGYPHAERRALAGNTDRGDIAGIPGIVIEAKATKALTLGPHLDETETERQNAQADYGALVWKRPRKPIHAAAVILPLDQFVQLLQEAGR